MSIIDRFIGLLAPYDCLGCSSQGDLLCRTCATSLNPSPAICYDCQSYSLNSRTCPACASPNKPQLVMAAVLYNGLVKDLLWKLKSDGAQQAARQMAQIMLPLLDTTLPYLVVPVPTATSRVRQRGYDQANLLARELSLRARLPRYQLLARLGQSHQVGAARADRHTQLQNAFRVRKPMRAKGATILLVDDVLTTGATLEAAAAALYAAGAVRVDAITFARA